MPAPKTPNTEKATAQRKTNAQRRKVEAARMLLRGEEGYLVLSREEVEEMLAKPIHKEGISAGWLRGYLGIPRPTSL
jgi:hypothetical protein